MTPTAPGRGGIDRRRFIQAGAAGTAAAAVWSAPSLLSLDQAFAATSKCSPTGSYTLNWATLTAPPAFPTALANYPWTTGNIGASGTAIKFTWSGNTTHLIVSGAAPPDVNTGVQKTYLTGNQTGVFNIFRNGAGYNESTVLRTRASRLWVRVPAVCPLDEFDGEDAGDGQVDLGESLVVEPVGVAA